MAQCEFAYGEHWWLSSVFYNNIQSPRDGYTLWKEIEISFPNNGFNTSRLHEIRQTKLNRLSQALIEKAVAEVFPSLHTEKVMRFHYSNIYFEDHSKKETLQLTFEYSPPVGDV